MHIKAFFFDLSSTLFNKLNANEVLLCTFRGELSDFVRLNHNKIRQAGTVNQSEFGLQLIHANRHCSTQCNISGQRDIDLQTLSQQLPQLREQIKQLPEDDYLHYNTHPVNTDIDPENPLPESEQAIEHLMNKANGLDLVGIYASGPLYQGFANSLGQRNWQTSHQFSLDWSCYLQQDKAVKSQYAGSQWVSSKLDEKFEAIHQQLEQLSKPTISLKPGHYRCYLSPTALSSILEIASWGGFGLKSHHSKSSPLIKLNEQTISLDARIRLSENTLNGFTPCFTEQGFIKPDEVILIDQGVRNDYLVNSRSAKEYNVSVNAQSETPQSLQLSGGQLQASDVLSALDTGILINNLWYTNFSERNRCRITGMTRFACFYIENGHIKAPIEVMRFDQSLYEILGDRLIDLTSTSECIASTDTYQHRSLSSMRLPGILVDGFRLSF